MNTTAPTCSESDVVRLAARVTEALAQQKASQRSIDLPMKFAEAELRKFGFANPQKDQAGIILQIASKGLRDYQTACSTRGPKKATEGPDDRAAQRNDGHFVQADLFDQ